MKKTLLFVAIALCALMTVSCKNNKAAKEAEQAKVTQEIVNATKVILTEEAKAILDELGKKNLLCAQNGDFLVILNLNLTEKEKLSKPDYVLNPANTKNLLTKSQKINALAILLTEYTIRKAYDMPLEESKEAMAKLIAETNFPIDFVSVLNEGKDPVETYQNFYNTAKETETEDLFWNFSYALQNASLYLISCNPDLYLKNVKEETYQNILAKSSIVLGAMKTLAPYSPEINNIVSLWDNIDGKYVTDPKEFSDLKGFKNVLKTNKDLYALVRAEALNK